MSLTFPSSRAAQRCVVCIREREPKRLHRLRPFSLAPSVIGSRARRLEATHVRTGPPVTTRCEKNGAKRRLALTRRDETHAAVATGPGGLSGRQGFAFGTRP